MSEKKRLRKFKASPRRYCFRCGKQCINTKGATSRAFVRVCFEWPYMKRTAPLESADTLVAINERAYIMCRQCFGKNLFFPTDRERYHSIKDYHELTGERLDVWGGVVFATAKYKFDYDRPWRDEG